MIIPIPYENFRRMMLEIINARHEFQLRMYQIWQRQQAEIAPTAPLANQSHLQHNGE